MTGSISRPRPTFVLLVVCLVVTGFAVLVPSVALLFESISAGRGAERILTLDHYARILSDQETFVILGRTAAFSLVMTLSSGSLGFFFAWVAARTNAPLRRFMPIAILLPYLIPPTLGAISWILLLSPLNGLVNELLRPIFGGPVFNIYSFTGMVFVESLYTFPLSFIFFYAAMSSLNPTLEEASAVSGANTFQTFVRTTVPVMWPTIVSVATLLFIIGFESFDVAWFLGYPAKIYILSIEMFLLTRYDYPPDMAGAAVYGVISLIAALCLVTIYRQITKERDRFVSITGKGYRAGALDIGRLRYPVSILFYGIILVIGVVPLLIWTGIAFQAIRWPFALQGNFSLSNFQWIWNDSESRRAIINTAILALGGATIVVVMSFFLGYAIMRTNERGRGVLDYVSFLPFAFPSTVLAVGIIVTLIRTPLYNTIWIMLLAFSIKFLPYGLRNLSSNLLQIHRELEEASFVSGAGLLQTMRRVVLPLALPGVVAAWSLLFIVFMRQFSLPIMLSSPGSQVVTIMLFQEWDAGQMGHVAAFGVVLVVASLPFIILARYLARERGGF